MSYTKLWADDIAGDVHRFDNAGFDCLTLYGDGGAMDIRLNKNDESNRSVTHTHTTCMRAHLDDHTTHEIGTTTKRPASRQEGLT